MLFRSEGSPAKKLLEFESYKEFNSALYKAVNNDRDMANQATKMIDLQGVSLPQLIGAAHRTAMKGYVP